MKSNDEKVREILQEENVPEEISPENMEKMLDEKTPQKKRSEISIAGRIIATVAACAIIVGVSAQSVKYINRDTATTSESIAETQKKETTKGTESKKAETTATTKSATATVKNANAPYMSGAENYEQVYKMLEKASKEQKKKSYRYDTFNTDDMLMFNDAETMKEEAAVEAPATVQGVGGDTTAMGSADVGGEEETFYQPVTEPEEKDEDDTESDEPDEPDEEHDEEEKFSETHNQEENVLEADIVKTDGKKIYYLSRYASTVLNVASVDKGKFTDTITVDVTPEADYKPDYEYSQSVNDMYLYNDMIVIIGTVNGYYWDIDDSDNYIYENDNRSFVSFYTKDAELIGTYWQDGCYKDVRIAPDGYMYLVSTYTSCEFEFIENADDTEKYIPSCGTGKNISCLPPEDILLPEKDIDSCFDLSYTIIGSIDLNVSSQFTPVDSKALAGYTGNIYSSADNMYITVGWEDTDITRIAIGGGNITPASSGKVEGYVKDQFSMSEYDGYFRIATTVNKWIDHGNFITDMMGIYTESEHVQDNKVYVLDMDMNIVGKVEDFGENETIKSVNFSGNMGYVVTYEQTDPLFAIDLSDPSNPFITDEFKILGYSTYMQSWTEGLLLGFGVDADENGIENGVKIVMFDNSDPYNLREVGLYSIRRTENDSVYSPAVWERKQLLIEPEKNIIGLPLSFYEYDSGHQSSKYVFFSYEDGNFIEKGEISKDVTYYGEGDSSFFDRAVFIGDYVYILSEKKFVAADIETVTVTDEATF